MRIIQGSEWLYTKAEDEHFFFERVGSILPASEVIMITSAKYIVGKDVVIFLTWVESGGARRPSITYSYSTQRRIDSGQIQDPGFIPRMLTASGAQIA